MCCLTKYEMRSFYVFSEMPHCNDGGKSRLGQGEMCYHLNMRRTAHILRQQVLESSQFCTCLFKLIECFKKFKQECMHCISLLINLLVTGFNLIFFFFYFFFSIGQKGSKVAHVLVTSLAMATRKSLFFEPWVIFSIKILIIECQKKCFKSLEYYLQIAFLVQISPK